MNKRMHCSILLCLALLLILNACSAPSAQNTEPKIPGLAQTLAVQTLNARPKLVFQAPQTKSASEALSPSYAPTFTPLPTGTIVPQLTPIAFLAMNGQCLNMAEFVKDVTIEDGDTVRPNKRFIKTWELRNSGTCTWTPDYKLVYVWGDQMKGNSPKPLGQTVKPGDIVDISLEFQAPLMPGEYQSDWMLEDTQGNRFGTGYNAAEHIWVSISCGLSGGGGLGGIGCTKGG